MTRVALDQTRPGSYMAELLEQLARSYLGVDNQPEVYQATVDVLHEALEPDVSLVVRRHLGDLVQIASRASGEHDVAPTLPSDSVPGTSLSLGEPVRVDDQDVLRGDVPESVDTPLSAYRSLIAYPFGENEVLVVGDQTAGEFDEADFDAVEYVATFASAVLEMVDAEDRPDSGEGRLEQVATILSHDVLNLLTVIDGNLSLLPDADEREEIASMYRSLHRLEQMIDDLVTLLRTEETDLEIQAVALRHVVADSWALVGDDDTRLVTGDLGTVMADESRLRQVLENLLRNAAEHTPEDGVVWVGVLEDGNGIYVEDDGPGIPPEKRDRVFDYGYSGSGDSTGFGLSIVQWIADAHGWDVRVTAADLGGARFELRGIELDRA